MISSTFRDLKDHRRVLIDAVERYEMHAVAMERDAALPNGTVLDASLQKVRDAAAYVGVVSRRYGQVVEAEGNPAGFSLTELEFREARRLGRPTLIFIMGERHPVTEADVELDAVARERLASLRDEVKRATADSTAHRVYFEFNDLNEFTRAALQSVAELRRHLDSTDVSEPAAPHREADDDIPTPPRLYAEPAYIGSHRFVGRAAQLTSLDDWASPANPNPVMLFEAIGGTGKSMLTWTWAAERSDDARVDWAGKLWYSFYESGAVLTDFCRRAIAYMTRRPLDELMKVRQPELSELLLRQLRDRPWLVVLDGLERVLVAYHRADAAQLNDDEAGHGDEIARRDPCDATRPLDDELLRSLAAAQPSKVLITSRLVPRALLNSARQPIPGVVTERLPGLRPPDAENLLRNCGVYGDENMMRSYLQRHCDCHPLVTGIIAGLVASYLPARGDFDAWAADPDHGGRLEVGALDLVQKRNHILRSALARLHDASRQLLSTLALLSDAADYPTVLAFSPDPPTESDPDGESESMRLAQTVSELEASGLLQYDRRARRYDLHPVVRAVCVSELGDDDCNRLGQRVVDYFSTRPRGTLEQAETLDDLRSATTIVRTYQRMGRMSEAFDAFAGGLNNALSITLEEHSEKLALLRPFFGEGWDAPSIKLGAWQRSLLITSAATALLALDEFEQAFTSHALALDLDIEEGFWQYISIDFHNVTASLLSLNRIAQASRFTELAMEAQDPVDEERFRRIGRLNRFRVLVMLGRDADAAELWQTLNASDLQSPEDEFLPGDREWAYATWRWGRDDLTEEVLDVAERRAIAGRTRVIQRGLQQLRGEWRLLQNDPVGAADSLAEAVRLAREAGIRDASAETWLAVAHQRLGTLHNARNEADRLALLHRPAHLPLARLWEAIGDTERAVEHALEAYTWAWADGEPFVRRFELVRASSALADLGADVPDLAPYSPAAHPPDPLERRIQTAIADQNAARVRARRTS